MNSEEIRRLLDKWYEGATDLSEERRLKALFASADSLPAEFEQERAIFEAMTQTPSEAMPRVYSERIDSAIEREMRFADPLRVFRRRIVYVAAGAAALLAVAFLAVLTGEKEAPERYSSVQTETSSATVERTAACAIVADTLQVSTEVPGRREQTAPIAVAKPLRRVAATEVPAEQKAQVPEAMAQEPEAKMQLASAYRIVDDEDEEEAIVNSFFMRLEGRMNEMNARVDMVDASLTDDFDY